MSPQAGFVLLTEIAPRLRVAIPFSVKTVGAEDAEELVQDGIAMAASMLHRLEESGKEVTPGNIAYYCILHLKSGRRSTGSSRADIMGVATQLEGRSSISSFETAASYDPETGEEIPLGEMLAGSHEDPASAGARNVDWELFLSTHDTRYGGLLKSMGEGRSVKESPLGYDAHRALKKKLAADLFEFMGSSAIADAMQEPMWRGNAVAERAKAACRADRR